MASVTVPTDATCDFILASNVDPASALAYQENGDNTPVHAFTRANASSSRVLTIAGRQAPVAFRPLIEGNSDIFSRQLIIAMDTPGNPVTNIDRGAFDALIALIENSDLPYIAVMDGHGRRWFAFVEYVDGTYAWNGHEHQADIKITEVLTVPTAVVTDDPPTP